MERSKKITLATIKSFVKKNADNIYIDIRSSFDGMVDCVTSCHGGMHKAEKDDREFANEHTLGIRGAWFVLSSRDHFSKFENEKFEGYHVSNCCGSFNLAVPKS